MVDKFELEEESWLGIVVIYELIVVKQCWIVVISQLIVVNLPREEELA
ncbi:MAG: hypothetical protein ABS934_04015 [Psychrobacillus sp.]